MYIYINIYIHKHIYPYISIQFQEQGDLAVVINRFLEVGDRVQALDLRDNLAKVYIDICMYLLINIYITIYINIHTYVFIYTWLIGCKH
jgi:hypothetical protein